MRTLSFSSYRQLSTRTLPIHLGGTSVKITSRRPRSLSHTHARVYTIRATSLPAVRFTNFLSFCFRLRKYILYGIQYIYYDTHIYII